MVHPLVPKWYRLIRHVAHVPKWDCTEVVHPPVPKCSCTELVLTWQQQLTACDAPAPLNVVNEEPHIGTA